MKRSRLLIVLLVAIFGFGFLFSLSACTPPPIYYGMTTCCIGTNGVSQIELKGVEYKFNIVDFPKIVDNSFPIPNSYVEVTYDYYNSTSNEITMPLYLVMGRTDYIIVDPSDYQFSSTSTQDLTLRCAYARDVVFDYDSNTASVEEFLKGVYDNKQHDNVYNADMPVYKYTYAVSDLSDEVSSMRIEEKNVSGTLFADKETYCYDDKYDDTYYVLRLDDTDTVTLYSLRNELTDIENNFQFCDESMNVVADGGKLINMDSSVMTFDDIAMTYHNNQNGLSESDWYNAVLSMCKSVLNVSVDTPSLRSLKFFDMDSCLTYMYQCNLVVPSQTDVSQTVRMPLYPTVDCFHHDEDVYIYNIDMSSLSQWRGTPEVSMYISTDGYYVQASHELTPTASGFKLERISTATKELSFTLSEVAGFDKDDNSSVGDVGTRLLIALLVVAITIALIPIITVSTVLGLDRAKRKKARKADGEITSTDTNTKE